MEESSAIPFACPRCDRPLDAAESGWICSGCKTAYPQVGGLPWLFAEPNAALGEWRGRFDYLLRALEANVRRFAEAGKRDGLLEATRQRLDHMSKATTDHARLLREILAPLAGTEPLADIETYLALRTRLPPDQGLMTYFPNVHRDWCWGEEENAASIGIVLEALGADAPGDTLVLGSGAGRLAYDLHEQTSATSTTALDFNPLLSLIGSRVAAGESLALYEFPLAPLDSDRAAVHRTLSAPHPARGGLSFVIADVHRPPFSARRFNTIVTPWLIDILPGLFGELSARINNLLADDGIWINFGSLNFHQSDPAAQLGPAECLALLEREGFADTEHKDTRIPYLCSPASRHGRRETVLSWRTRKSGHRKKVERHQALPDWIVRGKEPIPAIEHFRVAAASTHIHAQILALIDGKRSISDIAVLLEQHRLMPAREAEASIRNLFIKLFDESQIKRP